MGQRRSKWKLAFTAQFHSYERAPVVHERRLGGLIYGGQRRAGRHLPRDAGGRRSPTYVEILKPRVMSLVTFTGRVRWS